MQKVPQRHYLDAIGLYVGVVQKAGWLTRLCAQIKGEIWNYLQAQQRQTPKQDAALRSMDVNYILHVHKQRLLHGAGDRLTTSFCAFSRPTPSTNAGSPSAPGIIC